MREFLRDYSGSFAFSVFLHGLLVAALIATAVISSRRTATPQPLPIDAVVVDSQVVRQAEHAEADREAQAAAERQRIADQAKAAAEAKAQADAKAAEQAQAAEDAKAAAEAKAQVDAKAAEQQQIESQRAEAQKAQRAREAAAADLAAQAEREAEARKAAVAKAAAAAKAEAEAKAVADAKHAADEKARLDREADLKRQMGDEEHRNQVATGPLSQAYIAKLRNRIQNAWIKPPSATVGLDCMVEVTQIPGGEVTGARVTQCNGDAAARQSIENAVYRASPLPEPPDPALFERNFVFRFKPDE
ncbi:MAG TPA: cell envelope integrity protein TolA [Steroidobacteraceae bacterium]|jgi:colicin import membrane protein|nr:cell envelope integrity protein TolA [Steroidobacteraceae bacterium]